MTTSVALAWHNGSFLPQDRMGLPLHDAGLVFGATVTDLCRTFAGRLFRWPEHLDRFRTSCRLADVPLEAADDQLTAIAGTLVAHNHLLLPAGMDLALVLLATPGTLPHYLGLPPGPPEPTLAMHTFAIPLPRHARQLRDGARLLTSTVPHLPPACVPRVVKHRSRLFWWRAEAEVHARDAGASALLLDADGCVTETAAANFLVVSDGVLTSPLPHRVLAGVSLGFVRELCNRVGIGFAERDLTVADVVTADEALLTSTTFCLAPVASVNGQRLTCPGPTFLRLLQAWSASVGLDVAAQTLAQG